MTNLLPKKEQKEVVKEYKSRRMVVTVAAFGVTAFLCMLFLLPSFILSQVKLNVVAKQAEEVRARGEIIEGENDAAQKLLSANSKVEILESGDEYSTHSFVIAVTKHKNENIKIRTISYVHSAEEGNIRVGGLARDRESLTQFLKALESEEVFKSVDLPVSSFAKDKDIDFSMNIIVKK